MRIEVSDRVVLEGTADELASLISDLEDAIAEGQAEAVLLTDEGVAPLVVVRDD